MRDPDSRQRQPRSRLASRAALALGGYSLAGGAASLAGWAFDAPRLTDWFGHGISTQPNTAVTAMLAGAAVLALGRDARRLAMALAILVMASGVTALLQYLIGTELRGLNTALLFDRTWGRGGVTWAGLMGPAGATSWALIGLTTLLAADGTVTRRMAAMLPIIPFSIALLSFTGYLYGIDRLYALPQLTVIAFQTATFIAAVSIALTALIPEHPPMSWLVRDGAAGTVTRLATPLALLVPPLLGWLRLQGEALGLYDAKFGVAIALLVLVGPLIALIAWCAQTIARHEQALRDSESRAATTLESITDGFAALDRDWRFSYVNGEGARLLGEDARDLIGRCIWDLYPDLLERETYRALGRAARERASVEFEDYVPARQRWFFNKAYPTPDGGVCVYFEDVTAHKRLELLAAEHGRLLECAASGRPLHECLHELIEAIERVQPLARAGICIGDSNARIVELIDASHATSATAIAAAAALPSGSACEHVMREGHAVTSVEVASDERFSPAWRAYAAERGIAMLLSMPVRIEGGIAAVFFLAFDSVLPVTEREQRLAHFGADFVGIVLKRESAARRINEEFTAMTRLQRLATRLVQGDDIDALLQDVLSAATEITSTVKGNVQLHDPRTALMRIVVHQGHGPRFLAYFGADAHHGSCAAAARTGERVIVEDVLRHPDFAGTEDLDVLLADGVRACQSTPLKTRAGAVIGMLNTHFVLPRRPTDTQLRYLDLLARMAADCIERAHQEEALRDSDQRKNQFLAVLAHELRNPLAPIRTGTYLLRRQARDPEEVERTAAMMQRQVDQIVRLVDDLLDVSRITLDKIELRRERVDLRAVVRDAVEAVESLATRKRHRMRVLLPDMPVMVSGDCARLTQIVSNLLNNACKFMDDGGSIEVELARDGRFAQVRVRDYGIGISAEQLARVFEPFTQFDTSIERNLGGLGIGLSLVRKLVELHGGTIEARSAGHAQGSEFLLRLPAEITDEPHPHAAPALTTLG